MALELLLIVTIVFSNSCFPVPFKYFSVSSSLTINDFSSIIEMMESVIFTLVPAGITNSILAESLAILGKKEVFIIPPRIEPKVITNKDTKIPSDNIL